MSLRDWWRPDPAIKAFVADLNGVAYSSYTNQRLWIRTGNVILAAIVWALLTDHVARLDGLTGFLAVWCGYLLGKSGVTGLSRYGKSKTAKEYGSVVEAKERGKAQGKAIGEAITAEHDALKPVEQPAVTVTAKDQGTVRVDASTAAETRRKSDPGFPAYTETAESDTEHRWRDRKPDEGLG